MTDTSCEQSTRPLDQVLGQPVVTILTRADEVELGDAVDSPAGIIRVREIVQRPQYWTLAGDPPGQAFHVAFHPKGESPAPRTQVIHRRNSTIRVRRGVSHFGRLTGHSKHVTSHNPVKRGMYTLVDGYNSACSCGWKSSTVHKSKHRAGEAWLGHKAGQLTESTYAANSALLLIATAEVVHPQLPPAPWYFTNITSGSRHGHGIATADLRDLPADQARAVLAAWRQVPGLTVDEAYSWDRDEGAGGIVHTLRGPRRRLADMRLSLDGERGERLILQAAYETDLTAEEVAASKAPGLDSGPDW
ncbi:hypothetical protein ACF09J_07905 [Streptomyces sp. NPDC014889]|uniref:hypothetical protein n=1 Tax=Streptomyces sp. NPDC014889 TaxID=3364928 RepID=UPI0036F92F18